MRPSAQSIILGHQWSSRARDRFIMLVKGQSHIVSLYSILHEVVRVQLFINTETTNTSVLDILVREGHAVEAEESFDSKVMQQLGAQLVLWKPCKALCTSNIRITLLKLLLGGHKSFPRIVTEMFSQQINYSISH